MKNVKIMGTTTDILQRILAAPIEKLYTFSVKEPVQKELEQVVKRYFSTRVDRRFQTIEFIEMLNLV